MDISAASAITQSVAAAPSPAAPGHGPENRELIQTVKALNEAQYAGENRALTFSLDRATHELVFRIIDVQTKEVLQQFPAEYLLRLREAFDALAK